MSNQPDNEIRTYTIGRGSHCDIVLRDGSVSRNHAEIAFLPNNRGIVISDLDSVNGTFVVISEEVTRINQQHIRTSDTLQFGSVVKAVREIIIEIEQLEGPSENVADTSLENGPDTAESFVVELPEGNLRFDERGALVERDSGDIK